MPPRRRRYSVQFVEKETEEEIFVVDRHYKPVFCYTMIFVNIVLFIYEIALNEYQFEDFDNNPMYGPSVATLVRAGAKRTDLIVDMRQWHRLLLPMVLHSGIIHLALNSMAIFTVGVPLEETFGPHKIGILYFASGLSGTVLSSLFLPFQPTVGASGCIFGLIGASWSDLLQNFDKMDSPKKLLASLGVTTFLNIAIGLVPLLDNFAHIGGFLGGVSLGLGLLVVKTKYENGETVGRSFTQLLVGYGAAAVFTLYIIISVSLLISSFEVTQWCPSCQKINCLEVKGWWSCKTPLCPIQNISSVTTFKINRDTKEVVGLLPVKLDFVCLKPAGVNRALNLSFTEIDCDSLEYENLNSVCKLKTNYAQKRKSHCWKCEDAPRPITEGTPIQCMCELASCEACNQPVYGDLKRSYPDSL
eukprot:g4514.t1